MFLKLTRFKHRSDQFKIFNMQQVMCINPYGKGSQIETIDGKRWYVIETPKEILEMISSKTKKEPPS